MRRSAGPVSWIVGNASEGHSRFITSLLAICLLLGATARLDASTACPEEQRTPQIPTDLKLCAELEPIIRRPRALPLNEYQAKLGTYLQNFCHRDLKSGWKVDKRIRDTGPFVAAYLRGSWSANYYGTHAPVLVWYSPDMFAWLKANRPEHGAKADADAAARRRDDHQGDVHARPLPPAAASRGIGCVRPSKARR